MVTDAIIRLLAWLLNWFLGLIPEWQWPSSVGVPADDSFQGVGLPVGQVLNIQLAIGCITAILGAFAVSAGIKGVRILISHFTGGGGMA